MLDQHPHSPTGADHILWRGHCAVAEYAFDRAASLPRWTLPEATEVFVTDTRIGYAYTSAGSGDEVEIKSGELRWLYPQHIRVQPGSRNPGRAAAVTQIQLVCGGADGSFPALVFAGGDLTDIREADRLANVIRHAIARFRVDNADRMGLSISQARMLSKFLIGPEFTNFQGGEGQTVTMLGALPVPRPADPDPATVEPPATPNTQPTAPAAAGHAGYPPPPAVAHAGYPLPASAAHVEPSAVDDAAPVADPPAPPVGAPAARHAQSSGGGGRLPGYRPGLAADEARALQAAAAEQAAHQTEPDLASRAARLAAQVANLVANLPDDEPTPGFSAQPTADQPTPEQPTADQPTADLAARAEQIRRTAARFAGNSAKGKAPVHRSEHESGIRGQGR